MRKKLAVLLAAAMMVVMTLGAAGIASAKNDCGIGCGDPKPVKTGDKETDKAAKAAYKEQRKGGGCDIFC